MISLPAYEQVRILTEQKYPRQGPQAFKVPYYQIALQGIRNFYTSGNNSKELAAARIRAKSLNPESKRDNNLRVLTNFGKSRQAIRKLSILPQPYLIAQPAVGVDLKLKFDISAKDGGKDVRIFYNPRTLPIEPITAKLTLEIAHWILIQNSGILQCNALEYIDLVNGKVYKISHVSSRTSKLITANAKIIASLWPNI